MFKKRWTIVILWAILIYLSYLFSGCSATRLIRMAKKKDPSLFDTLRTVEVDTVIKEVPVVKEKIVFETDTIYGERVVENEVIRWRFIRTDPDCDSIQAEIDCPDPKIITIKETETIPPIIVEPTFWDFAKRYGWTWAVLIVVMVILGIIKQFT